MDGAVAQTSYADGTAALRISSVSTLDQGEYCCQATNSAGFQASKATLTVLTTSAPLETVANGHSAAAINGEVAEAPTPVITDEVKPPEPPKEALTAPVIRRDVESKIVKEGETAILESEFDGNHFCDLYQQYLCTSVTTMSYELAVHNCRLF